jgi:hypothetical protein
VADAFPQAGMDGYAGKLVIIQPGAQQLLIFQRETKRFYEVQLRPRIGAQPYDIPGVRRNFRLVQDYVECHT